MNNDEYVVFEEPFQALAMPILERLKTMLTQKGYGPFGDVSVTDHDVSRGMEFSLIDPREGEFQSVEIILVDGAESGFEGVALRMECSMFFSGCVWQPGNYTDSVSITTVEDLEDRWRALSSDLEGVCESIESEWESDHFKNISADSHNN